MARDDYWRRAWCASDTGVIYGVMIVMSRRVYGAETVRLFVVDGASRPPVEAVEPPSKSGDICRRRTDHPSRRDSSTIDFRVPAPPTITRARAASAGGALPQQVFGPVWRL